MEPLLSVRNLRKTFAVSGQAPGARAQKLVAVDGVSFDLYPGETLGLVGESGCGKSTTGKLLLRLLEADGGEVRFAGQDLCNPLPAPAAPPAPADADDLPGPLFLPQPAHARRRDRRRTAADPRPGQGARRCGMRWCGCWTPSGWAPNTYDRYPHEFSGGQRQRIGIARALAVRPQLIVADEPVSALDLSIQAQVVNLLQDLQEQFGLTYLFIAHDLSVIEHLSDRVAVMYLGRIVELAQAAALYRQPRHPYSEALLDAVPDPRSGRAPPPPTAAGGDPLPHRPAVRLHLSPPLPLRPPGLRRADPAPRGQGGRPAGRLLLQRGGGQVSPGVNQTRSTGPPLSH